MNDKIIVLFNKLKKNREIAEQPRYQKAFLSLKKELANEISAYIRERKCDPMIIAIESANDIDIVQVAFHEATQTKERIIKGVFEQYDINSVDREMDAYEKKLRDLYEKYIVSHAEKMAAEGV